MSKTSLLITAIILSTIGILAFWISQSPFSSPMEDSQPAKELVSPVSDFATWHEFHAPSGEFVVLMPSLPQYAKDNLVDPKTQEPRQYDMYVAEEENSTVYMISIITLNSKDPKADDQVLTAVMNDMLASTPQGKLNKMEIGKYKGYPSIDFSIENGEVIIDGKVFLTNLSLFALTSVTKRELYHRPNFDFFINSFQLKNLSPLENKK